MIKTNKMTQIIITETIKTEIQKAIKAQKWDKSSYAYAVHGMSHWDVIGFFPDQYKKAEVIARFWELIETKFYMIKDYTTFKNITL